MASLNKVVLIGHMVADPELKQTSTGTYVCNFAIGVSRKFTKKSDGDSVTDFLDIIAWAKQAEFVSKYFKKGNAICICGSIETRIWTTQDGSKRKKVEIVADEVSFIEKKSDSGSSFAAPSFGGGDTIEAPHFEEVTGEDELPF